MIAEGGLMRDRHPMCRASVQIGTALTQYLEHIHVAVPSRFMRGRAPAAVPRIYGRRPPSQDLTAEVRAPMARCREQI